MSRAVHNAESWTDIMLRNTAHLQTEEDQHAFWAYMTNPDEQIGLPPPEIGKVPEATPVAKTFETDDGTIVEQKVVRNGMSCFIASTPEVQEPSKPSPTDQTCGDSDEGDEKCPETVSTQ